MKHVTRIIATGTLAALLSASVSLAGSEHDKHGGGYGHKMPKTPNINVHVPKVSTHVFNVTVPVPNVHIPMMKGERHKKDGGGEKIIERETKIIEREKIVEREIITNNNNTTFVGGGGGSSFVIVQAPPVPIGKIDIAEPEKPKPVKAECLGPKGHLFSAWRVSPAEFGPEYEGEVFRCEDGHALGATVGRMVDGYADYKDGFIIECLPGEALRFGRGGKLACAPAEHRTGYGHTKLAGGPAAEVLIYRGEGRGGDHGPKGRVSLEGMVLTGGVGGTVY